MLKERFKLKVGVFLVLFNDNNVLLSRRYNTGIADGLHVLPMGGLDEGETITEAMAREALEEVNIVVEPQALKMVHVMHRIHHFPDGETFPQVDIFFIPQAYSGTISNGEPHKCDELKFYPLSNLPRTLEPFIKQALQCIHKGELYSEFGWPNNNVTDVHTLNELKSLVTDAESLSPAIYDLSASTYDYGRKADAVLVDKFIHHLERKDHGRYVDIGCGSGNYTVALSRKGFNIEGLDISPAMLAQARQKTADIPWWQGDMKALPFESCSFEGALTVNTLHYVRNTLTVTFLEIGRILKPGGKLVIFIVALEQCLQFWLGYYFPFFREVGYRSLASQNSLVEALNEAGFQEVQVEPFFVTEHTSDLFTYACKYRPHLFLDPNIRKGMTPLQLPEYAEEVRLGCERLQEDIASGAIYRVISQHESQLGEGLIISAKKI